MLLKTTRHASGQLKEEQPQPQSHTASEHPSSGVGEVLMHLRWSQCASSGLVLGV